MCGRRWRMCISPLDVIIPGSSSHSFSSTLFVALFARPKTAICSSCWLLFPHSHTYTWSCLFFYVPVSCLKFIMNRIVGIWIILDTFLAQLPQLLKILWRRNAEGLSLTSVLLQLYAFSCPVVYAMANNYPLFAWAERLVTLAQTAAIVFLILHYRGDTLSGMVLLLLYGAAMFLLGSFAAAAVVSMMQASSLAALITSKVTTERLRLSVHFWSCPTINVSCEALKRIYQESGCIFHICCFQVLQARTNQCHGHTGQLSSLSVLLSWAGSLGVLLVSLQEAGSLFTTLSQALSASVSCVLLAQVLCCRSSAATTKTKSE
ncbi:mannose-P-dolichol utilization defect 1 protein-like isoform 2-T2 [Spinachia spinachia]